VSENIRRLSIVAGPLSALALYALLPATFSDGAGQVVMLDHAIRAVIAIACWMALWWITEAVPMAVTALLPIAVFPLLGLASFKSAAEPYAHPLIFLFFGGFLISIAIQKWGLHRRFAASLLRRVGTDPARLIGGFMIVTAFLSMWLSNTSTTIMMLPVALSVIAASEDEGDFAKCLLLAVAYSASIGGMGTIIGTPPNLYVASYFNDVLGVEIGFLTWMTIGVPCALLLLPAAWFFLTRIHFSLPSGLRAGTQAVTGRGLVWHDLGRGGRATLIVFGAVVCGWVTRPWIAGMDIIGITPFTHLSDAGIALIAACALFVIPVDLKRGRFVLDWSDTRDLPWGTLILFGGGLSLAASINATGADQVIGLWVSRLPSIAPILLVTAIVALVVLLTELTSNIATTATLVPVLAAAAPLLGLDAEMVIAMVALAASCAFMLPVATPPNAIVFGSGRIGAADMALAGVGMNLLGLLVISLIGYGVIPLVLH
jgi:solute carrier family 13 (sodium-dependent dicarboxylate transporter), member 2/3/5